MPVTSIAVSLFSAIGSTIWTVNFPSSPTVAVAIWGFPSLSLYDTVIVSPGSPLPVISGVVSFVVNSSTSGAAEGLASIITIFGSVLADSFPAASVDVAVKACSPSSNVLASIDTTIGFCVISCEVNVYVPTGSFAEYIVIISPAFGLLSIVESLAKVIIAVGVLSSV